MADALDSPSQTQPRIAEEQARKQGGFPPQVSLLNFVANQENP